MNRQRAVFRSITLLLGTLQLSCGQTSIVALDRGPDCAAPRTGQMARPAGDLVDFVGVGLRLSYTDTAYADEQRVQDAIVELGVRHVADVAGSNELLPGIAQTNASLLLLDTLPSSPSQLSGATQSMLDFVELAQPHLAAAATITDWQSRLDSDLSALRAELRAEPQLASVRLVSPALPPGVLDGVKAQMLPEVDVALLTQWPGASYPGAPELEAALDARVQELGDKPKLVSQTGYSTSQAASASTAVLSSEVVQAKYTVRWLLELFSKGLERAYLAQLVDWHADDAAFEDRLGLVRGDFSRKPAFDLLRNLLQLLSGPGSSRTVNHLGYALTGDTTSVRQLLLSGQSNHFWLLAWLELPSTDQDVSRQLSLELTEAPESVTTYHPQLSPFASERSTAQSLPITLSDFPTLFEIVPRCGP